MPDISALSRYEGYYATDIVQTYLCSEAGVTHRVRRRTYADRTVYTQTKKVRIDKMSSEERERELTEREYLEFLSISDGDSKPVVKTRHSFTYRGQLFEVDIYPEWTRTCILETELADRSARAEFPPEIRVLLEVTGEWRFSNAAMARSFPTELI